MHAKIKSSGFVVRWFRPWITEFVDGFAWPAPPGTVATSWYRTRRSMTDESQHRLAIALDFDFDFQGGDLGIIERWAQRSPWVVIRESDHVHVQMLAKGTLRRLGLDFSDIP